MLKLLIIFIFFLNLQASSLTEPSGLKNPFIYKIYKSTVPIPAPTIVIYALGTIPILQVPWDHFPSGVKDLLSQSDHFIAPFTKEGLNQLVGRIHREFIPLISPELSITEEIIQELHEDTNRNLITLYNDSLDGEMINFARNHSIESSSLYDEEDAIKSFAIRYQKYVDLGMNTLGGITDQEIMRFLYPMDMMQAYIDGQEDLILQHIRDAGLSLEKSVSFLFLNKIISQFSFAAMMQKQNYKVFASIPIQHLLGEEGIISLLKENDYIVEKLFQRAQR
jgi:hypothetical protein